MKIKNLIRTILVLAIIFAVTGVSAQVERDPDKRGGKKGGAAKDKEASMERIKTKIESINAEIAKFMISHNVNQMMKYYTTNAIILPNNARKLSGKAAIKKSWEENKNSGVKFKSVKFTTETLEKAGNYFYEIGKYQMEMEIEGVPGKVSDIGKYLIIWEKKGKEFLIKVEVYNSDVDPMSQFMKEGGDKKPDLKPEKDEKK